VIQLSLNEGGEIEGVEAEKWLARLAEEMKRDRDRGAIRDSYENDPMEWLFEHAPFEVTVEVLGYLVGQGLDVDDWEDPSVVDTIATLAEDDE